MNSRDAPPFWLVWCPSAGPPNKQHGSRAGAHQEAERLARQSPGERFYVLEPVSESVRNEVTTRFFAGSSEDDAIPF
jgi:hypothetical protein